MTTHYYLVYGHPNIFYIYIYIYIYVSNIRNIDFSVQKTKVICILKGLFLLRLQVHNAQKGEILYQFTE